MFYYTLEITGGENTLTSYPTKEARDQAANNILADLAANSGLPDDNVISLDSDAPITMNEVTYPSHEQIEACRRTAKLAGHYGERVKTEEELKVKVEEGLK